MCLIEYGSRLENVKNKKIVEDSDIVKRLSALDSILDNNIK